MGLNRFVATSTVIMAVALVAMADPSKVKVMKKVDGKLFCDQSAECEGPSEYCCNDTISDLFEEYQFNILFPNRNAPASQAINFWDYTSFITAASYYEPLGFGTTGGKMMQMKEVAAFLAHVAAATTCGSDMSTGGPLSWGLCYYKEMSPTSDYCNSNSNYEQKCVDGVQYYFRGALPISGNEDYAITGEGLKLDLLSHPEILEQNATLAFKAAMWKWMTRLDKHTPSPHIVLADKWKPTKNDTLSKRRPGFGTTMNILYGYTTCANGDTDRMNNIISHYLYFLDLMGVGRENANETHEALSCGDQIPFARPQKLSS